MTGRAVVAVLLGAICGPSLAPGARSAREELAAAVALAAAAQKATGRAIGQTRACVQVAEEWRTRAAACWRPTRRRRAVPLLARRSP